MRDRTFAYIWKYKVNPLFIERFTKAYESDGDWARLFQLHSGYIKTELLKDTEAPDGFITIDYWKTKSDRDDFRRRYEKEFRALDETCEAYTLSEEFLGDFDLL